MTKLSDYAHTPKVRKPKPESTCIICTWHDRGDELEVYTTIHAFLRKNPGRSYQTIINWIGRRKLPFVDEQITLKRVTLVK